jgi:hypothetical protein
LARALLWVRSPVAVAQAALAAYELGLVRPGG